MKKISINTLCIIIIAILATNVLTVCWGSANAFMAGLNAGFNSGSDGAYIESVTPFKVKVVREGNSLFAPTDTIYLDDGRTFPAMVDRATVLLPTHSVPLAAEIVNAVAVVAIFVLLVMLIIQFVKFIVNINKGHIFEYKNIRHLRRFGIYLLAIACLQCFAGLYNDYILFRMNLSDATGLALADAWTVPWSDFLFGCLALLMAQIWTRGLKMRELQDLTI
ncbi:MAG: DUF2975 domain-containing protein [Muribaculaceae bacterium]|nr:DUF2975 domain-containing protein [Muribaculaceae bacterium]